MSWTNTTTQQHLHTPYARQISIWQICIMSNAPMLCKPKDAQPIMHEFPCMGDSQNKPPMLGSCAWRASRMEFSMAWSSPKLSNSGPWHQNTCANCLHLRILGPWLPNTCAMFLHLRIYQVPMEWPSPTSWKTNWIQCPWNCKYCNETLWKCAHWLYTSWPGMVAITRANVLTDCYRKTITC